MAIKIRLKFFFTLFAVFSSHPFAELHPGENCSENSESMLYGKGEADDDDADEDDDEDDERDDRDDVVAPEGVTILSPLPSSFSLAVASPFLSPWRLLLFASLLNPLTKLALIPWSSSASSPTSTR